MFKFRPWGWWAVLWQWPLFSEGPRYKLKLLYFKKGGAISMQRHMQRTEQWKFLFSTWRNGFMKRGFHDDWPPKRVSAIAAQYPIQRDEWHRYYSREGVTLVLETQRGICQESDIERAA